MIEQQSNRQADISNKYINLRSLLMIAVVVLLIGSSSSLLNGCGSENRSRSLSPGMSDQELLEESRKARSEAMETLRRVDSQSVREVSNHSLGETLINVFDRQYVAQNTSKQQFLSQVASKLNESLPMSVDKDTVLKNVAPYPDGLVYNYILVNYSFQDVNPDILANNLYPIVKNQACSEPGMQFFWENDISVYYSYFGNDNKFITRFVVSPSDCGY